MMKYYEEVESEAKRIEPNIIDTIKFLKRSINPDVLPNTSIYRVGTLDLGTLYSINKEYQLDIAMYNTEDKYPQ